MVFWGSRGDVQPGVALAAELQSRGHDVHFGCPPNYLDFARRAGVQAYPMGPDSEAHWTTPDAQELLRTRNPITKLRIAKQHFDRGFAALDDDLVALVHDENGPLHGADVIIGSPLGQERVFALAESQGIPAVILRYCALSENGVVTPIRGVPFTIPAAVNRVAWRMLDELTWTVLRVFDKRFRSRIGLSPGKGSIASRLHASSTAQIQAYDPIFFPGLAEEWGQTKPLVGFFELPLGARDKLGESVSSHSELLSWLAAGSPPIYIGFGSVPAPDPDALVDMIGRVCREQGHRALISIGNSSRVIATDDVRTTGAVDHSAVLPQCVAAVHHGGAGTTAASMRAGLPTMVCWRGADQAYWADRVVLLGAGTSVKLTELDEATLRAHLLQLADPAIADRAREVSAAMRSPADAVAEAARIVESARTVVAGVEAR